MKTPTIPKMRTDWKKKYEEEVVKHKSTVDYFSKALKDFDLKLDEHKKSFKTFMRFTNLVAVMIAVAFIIILLLLCLKIQYERTNYLYSLSAAYDEINACQDQFESYKFEVPMNRNPEHSFFNCCFPEECAASESNPRVCNCYYTGNNCELKVGGN